MGGCSALVHMRQERVRDGQPTGLVARLRLARTMSQTGLQSMALPTRAHGHTAHTA